MEYRLLITEYGGTDTGQGDGLPYPRALPLGHPYSALFLACPHFFGFTFVAQPQPPAQPPSLRRRATAIHRRTSQPVAAPTKAHTRTKSRLMRAAPAG